MKCGDIVFCRDTGQIGEVRSEIYKGADMQLHACNVQFGESKRMFMVQQFNRLLPVKEIEELLGVPDEMVLIAGPAPRI